MISGHFNHDYIGGAGTVPHNVGDRFYGQDLGGEFQYLRDRAGLVLKDLGNDIPVIISGGIVSKGTGNTLNITICIGYLEFEVRTIDLASAFALPPDSALENTTVRVESTAQVDMAIGSAVLDDVAMNYVKLAYAEANGLTRARAKKAGSYIWARTPSFTITVDDSAPDATEEIELARFVSVGNNVPATFDLSGRTPTYRGSEYLRTVDLFSPRPWNKSLHAAIETPLHTGTCDADTAMALEDSGANFADVSFGDVVENTDTEEFATVLFKSGATVLYLDADIYPAGNENYAVYSAPSVPDGTVELTGALLAGDGVFVADTNTLNHLIDTVNGDFVNDGVSVGDWAMNLDTGKIGKVTNVAATDLTLQWDTFPNGNEPYMVFAGIITIDDSESAIDGRIITEMNIGGRFIGGGISALRAEDDRGQGHYHENQGTPFNVGAAAAVEGLVSAYGNNYNYVRSPKTDGVNGIPRTGEDTRPRTLRQVMIMRIK